MPITSASGRHLIGDLARALKIDRPVVAIRLDVPCSGFVTAEVEFYLKVEDVGPVKLALEKYRIAPDRPEPRPFDCGTNWRSRLGRRLMMASARLMGCKLVAFEPDRSDVP